MYFDHLFFWLHEQNEGVQSGKSGRFWNEGPFFFSFGV
jgi:hypothetical protein